MINLKHLSKLLSKLFIIVCLCILLFLLAVRLGAFGKLPNVNELKNPIPSIASEIYSYDSILIGRYYVENRINIEYKDLSPWLIKAFSANKSRFNLSRLIAYQNFHRKPIPLFSGTIVNAIKLIFVEMMINNRYTDEEKLVIFLNNFDFLHNANGIESASRLYFNKKAKDIDVNEAAILIGMLANPIQFNPIKKPNLSFERKNVILKNMLHQKIIKQSVYDSLKNVAIKLDFHPEPINVGVAPYFRMVLAEYLKSWAKENKKPDGSSYNIYTDGLKIYTTINIKMQEYAEAAAVEHLAKHQKILDAQFRSDWNTWNTEKGKKILLTACKYTDKWQSLKDQGLDDDEIIKVFKSQKNKMQLFSYKGLKDTTLTAYDSVKYYKSFLQVGCMSMETQTGYVRAWVGGVNFDYFKVDHCNINTKRQVGSLFKTIVYTLAIKNGESPCDVREPFTKSSSGGRISAYIFKNDGVPAIIDMSKRMGIISNLPPYAPIALGAADISLFEMMQVYSVFPNAGYTTKPQFLLSIKDKNGNTIQDFHQQRNRVISDTVAYKMIYMMKSVVDSGAGASLKHRFSLDNIQIAGKTGTTNKNTDAWFIGYTPQLITGVWVGCDEPIIHLLHTGNGQGATAAMPIFGLFMNKVYNDNQLPLNKKQDFFIPSDTTLIKNPCGK